MSNSVPIDPYRNIKLRLKKELGAKVIVVNAVLEDDSIMTFIDENISDIELVYIIQCLKDRRDIRWRDINDFEA